MFIVSDVWYSNICYSGVRSRKQRSTCSGARVFSVSHDYSLDNECEMFLISITRQQGSMCSVQLHVAADPV